MQMVRYSGIINAGLITRHNIRRYERLGWQRIHHPDYLKRVVDKIKAQLPVRCGRQLFARGWHLSLVFGCTYSQCEWRSDSLVSNTDTTEIKEAEEKLVEYQQELEAIVEERTKDF
jgi:hypothetical protein